MKTISEIREGLQKVPNLADMGRELKVTRSYLWAIKDGLKLNPSAELMERMSDYLEQRGY